MLQSFCFWMVHLKTFLLIFTQFWRKMLSSRFSHFFSRFFAIENQNSLTFLLLECMQLDTAGQQCTNVYSCNPLLELPCLSVHSLVCLLSHVALGRLLSYVARTHTHLWACATRTAWVTQPERPKDEVKRLTTRRMCKKLCRRFSIILEAFWQIWSYKVNAKFEQRCSTDI